MDSTDTGVWTRKGETLSNKNAEKEYGITHAEIVEGIRTGKLRYQSHSVHGNPYWKLVRTEIEALLKAKYGEHHLARMAATTRLKKVTTELRKLKREMNKLAKEKVALEGDLEKMG